MIAAVAVLASGCGQSEPAQSISVDEAQATYFLFQRHETEIFREVRDQLGEDRFAGIWLTRDSWEVNIGIVGGNGDDLDLPAPDELVYIFHNRPESLADLEQRARSQGKRVDVRTGQLVDAEEYVPGPSDL